jgi:methionine-rich copper-binding protein CopC
MPKFFRRLAGMMLFFALLSGAVEAHAILLSFKIDGQDAVLNYNGRVDAARSRVLLLDAKGANPQPLTSVAGSDPATLRAHLGDLPAGSYILRWEVLSVDGHISRGDQKLTLPTP